MSDRTVTAEELADLYASFPGLKEALQESDLDPDQPEIATAALATARVLLSKFNLRTDKWTSEAEKLKPQLDELAETIKAREPYHEVTLDKVAIGAVGFTAAGFTLFNEREAFARSMKLLGSWLEKLVTSFFGIAHAATLGSNEATASIFPSIIYGGFGVLAIGYVGSFFAMIFAPDKKIRSNAYEYVKQVTALFIGVVGGKVI